MLTPKQFTAKVLLVIALLLMVVPVIQMINEAPPLKESLKNLSLGLVLYMILGLGLTMVVKIVMPKKEKEENKDKEKE